MQAWDCGCGCVCGGGTGPAAVGNLEAEKCAPVGLGLEVSGGFLVPPRGCDWLCRACSEKGRSHGARGGVGQFGLLGSVAVTNPQALFLSFKDQPRL